MKENIQKSLFIALILSETSHVFCCVLPTIFSLFSLLVGMGMAATMPGFLVTWHDYIHAYEIPVIAFSGLILAFGWGITWYSDRMDCHDSGCCHGECAPKKSRAHVILMIATALFLFNLAIYVFVHRGMDISPGHAHEPVAAEATHS